VTASFACTAAANHWVPGPKSNQSFILPGEKASWATDARDMMDSLLCQPPKSSPASSEPQPQPYPITSLWGKFAQLPMGDRTSSAGGSLDAKAWDGDIYTFYSEHRAGVGGAWTQAELDGEHQVVFIEFYARADSRQYLNRTIGGRFVGVTADGESVTLATINRSSSRPVDYGNWNGLPVSGNSQGAKVRWVRYEAPAGSDGDIAEIKLYGHVPQPTPTPPAGTCEVATTAPLSGAGPPSKFGHGGGNFTLAWDDDVFTFYDFNAADGGWTMATMVKPTTISHIEYYPRDGFLSRSAGGNFIGISSGHGEEVTLATITTTPTLGWRGLQVVPPPGATAGTAAGTAAVAEFVAVKYVAPDGGFGNIAEIKIFTTVC
jgi:hypothetical protein